MHDTTPQPANTEPDGDTIDVLDIHRIMHAIPHRYPFLMIDRVVDVVRNKSASSRMVRNATDRPV